MWKPYNSIVVQGKRLVILLLKAFPYLGNWILLYLKKCIINIKLNDVLGYCTSTLTIVAFIHAAEYFSAKPSLIIQLHSRSYGYNMDSLQAYYHVNKIEFPKQLMDDQSLGNLFVRDTKLTDPNYMEIFGWTSDEDIIRAIGRGQNIGAFIEYKINSLERQIGKYNYVKHIYGHTDNRGFRDEQEFSPVLDYIKSKLSTSDYYIFLASLIYSREVSHTVFIKNDGDLDLKNVRVTFPAPVSKVTEGRANNILSRNVATSLLHEIIVGTSEITLCLPSLKKGDSLVLDIRTRENEIDRNEVFSSYERDDSLDKRGIIVTVAIIFVVIMLFRPAFRDREPASS